MNGQLEKRPVRRRWYQFSLRTLIVAMVVASVLLGLFASRLQRARRQAAAVAVIRDHGSVEYDYAYRRDGEMKLRLQNGKSNVPHWLLDRLGEDFFHDVVLVLARQQSLRSPTESDKFGQSISQLPTLEELYVDAYRDDEIDLSPLQGMRRLEHVSISGGRLNNASLDAIKPLPALRNLELDGVRLEKPRLASLKRIRPLSELALRRIDLDLGDLSSVAACRNLQNLEIDGILVAGRDIDALAQLHQLKTLRLLRAQLTDRSLARLASLENLVWLDISHNDISDAGTISLARLSHLKSLDLRGTRVTGAKFPTFPELRSLDLSSTELTDEGLLALATQPKLQSVAIARTRVSKEAVDRFRRSRPNVGIDDP